VTVTEFFDYECSHCRQAFHGMHQLLALNPDRLRLVVRHFPLDQACNRFISRPIYLRSCLYAKLANCAGEQQHFWEAHEYLFEHSRRPIQTPTFAAELSLDTEKLDACMKRENQALSRDIEAGIALELHGTPVFVVDGKVYLQRPPQLLAEKLRLPGSWH
jgi:protein-disulfide isomerase